MRVLRKSLMSPGGFGLRADTVKAGSILSYDRVRMARPHKYSPRLVEFWQYRMKNDGVFAAAKHFVGHEVFLSEQEYDESLAACKEAYTLVWMEKAGRTRKKTLDAGLLEIERIFKEACIDETPG